MVVSYCTAQEVVNFLRLKDEDGHRLIIDDANPHLTKTDIETLINDAEDYIDDHTHTAWRSTNVSNELYNFPYARWGYHGYRYPLSAIPEKAIQLTHRNIRGPFVSGTDKIEVWESGSYVDYVATKTEGRANDWWCDYEQGILYFVSSYPTRYLNAVRLTYRYGFVGGGATATVPKDIRRTCILLVARDILSTEGYSVLVPQGASEYSFRDKIELWEAAIDKIIKHRQEFQFAFEV